MDYEKVYKEALERAKNLHKDAIDMENNLVAKQCEIIFPELAESEYEKIRKALIELVKFSKKSCFEILKDMPFNVVSMDAMLSWLEKQGSLKDIIDRYKTSWYNEGKIAGMAEGLTDDEKYQQGWHDALEKQGEQGATETQSEEFDDNIITRDDEILQAISIGLNDIIEDFGWSDFGGLSIEEIQSWLEKQGERKSIDNKEKLYVLNFIRKETCCGLAEANNALLKLIKVLKEHPFPIMDKSHKLKIEWEEQQGEQNPVNKVELKFKVGDWIIRSNKAFKHNTYLIKEVKDYYVCEELKGRRVPFTFDDVHKNFKLWDIADAKTGDVLNANGAPFIYKKHNKDYVYFYCGVNLADEFVEGNGNDTWNSNSKVYPATKEQRDHLFKKMREAGYWWDEEKKELKNIESKFHEGDWLQYRNNINNPCQIISINDNWNYIVQYCDDEKTHVLSKDFCESYFHLWTIDDAKDHDILTVNGRPFIYCCNDDYQGNYCCIDSDGVFRTSLDFGFNGKTILPATKKQRDLILQMSKNTPLNY